MLLYLIRHGKTDYSQISKNENCSATNLAPLSEEGIKQAQTLQSFMKRLPSAKIISSPYTRALQTAYIASDRTDIEIEYNLHEWLPDKSFRIRVDKIAERNQDFKNRVQNMNYEKTEEMQKRFASVIEKYKKEKVLIVFSHARIIASFLQSIDAGNIYLKNCQIAELESEDEKFKLKRII